MTIITAKAAYAAQTGSLPDVPEAVISEIVSEINSKGFGCYRNYISPDDLSDLQSYILGAIEQAGGQYVALNGKQAVAGSLLEAIADSPKFNRLVRRLYEAAMGEAAPAQSLYQVCRCLTGDTGVRQSYIFHFDSYVLTVLLPIIIPAQGQRGDLVMVPNLRPVHKSYFRNLIDKVLVDNKLTQRFLRLGVQKRFVPMIRVPLEAGNLYFFWGYRSLHANEPCDVENVRSTALFHFGDPHADSGLRQRMGRVKVSA